MQLVKSSLPLEGLLEPEVLVEPVLTEKQTSNNLPFYGLFNNVLAKRCWTNDGRLVYSTEQKHVLKTYLIDIETSDVAELPCGEESQEVLDVYENIIVVRRSSFFKSDKICIAEVPERDEEVDVKWIEITEAINIDKLDGLIFHCMELTSSNASDDVREFNTIYLGPEEGEDKQVPLIVYPHGGPTSSFVNQFSIDCALFNTLGYAVLLVNYRGSSGAGQKNAEFLIGRVGKVEISDCVLATVQAFIHYPWIDPNRTSVYGVSYGGYMATFLSSQYPDMYKSVVTVNGVTDWWNETISDIPDIAYIYFGFDYTLTGESDPDVLLKMKKASPIQYVHKVKAPTLIVLGSKDRRVPCSQGIEYYHSLRANGVSTKVLVYDDMHIIGDVINEMDYLINAVLWIDNCTREEED